MNSNLEPLGRGHEPIKQFVELSFQTIFAGAIGIRHRGSKESCECCAASIFQMGTYRFTESADDRS